MTPLKLSGKHQNTYNAQPATRIVRSNQNRNIRRVVVAGRKSNVNNPRITPKKLLDFNHEHDQELSAPFKPAPKVAPKATKFQKRTVTHSKVTKRKSVVKDGGCKPCQANKQARLQKYKKK